MSRLRRCVWKGFATVAALLLLGSRVSAHGTEISTAIVETESAAWTFEPGVVISLFLSATLYALGMRQLPRRVRSDALFFYAGWLFLVIALVSPVHRLGALLFSVHMTQHELLMVGAAPLLVLGHPGRTLLKSLPRRISQWSVNPARRRRALTLARYLTRPAIAWLMHALALWCWHIPSWFEATLHHEWAHALQHLSFLGTALWFWHSVFRGPRRIADYGWGVLNLFFTAIHSSVLGALITFAPGVWYPTYAARARITGISPLEDQQLGGLIMWVPAGLVYLLAALVLIRAWLHGRPAKAEALIRNVSSSDPATI